MEREEEKVLILCVDRDDDIGEKTGIKGPIVGRENALKTAVELSIADPEESDSNAIFGAIKLYDELANKYSVEVAILTGDKRKGIEADAKIARQMDRVIYGKGFSSVIFVTDGKDDELILPVIESRLPVLSVKRIIVRQSSQLESGYYKLKDFIEESLRNPRFSIFILGLPAISLIIYALFESFGYRIMMGIFGIYLFIKGFQLEKTVNQVLSELSTSFIKRKTAFFFYIASLMLLLISIFRGYNYMLQWISVGFFESVAAFFSSTVYLLWVSGSIAWVGNVLSRRKKSIGRLFSLPLFGLAISVVVKSASETIINESYSLTNFMISIVLGLIISFLAVVVDRRLGAGDK